MREMNISRCSFSFRGIVDIFTLYTGQESLLKWNGVFVSILLLKYPVILGSRRLALWLPMR